MRILTYKNKKINIYISIFIICFVLSFFVPWYTIAEKKDFSGFEEETYYNYKLTGFERTNIHYYGDEKNIETVQTLNNDNGMARTTFFIYFGILFLIFGIFFILSIFKVSDKPEKKSSLMKFVPPILILIFIGGYLLAYQADYYTTEYGWDDLYIKNIGFFGYGERIGVRGFGIDSSGECETTMVWYPNVGFILLIVITLVTLLIQSSIKKVENQSQMKVNYITFKLFKWKLMNDLQFRVKFYSICLIIFLLLSLMLPWFTIRNRYHEEDYSYLEDYIYTINYYPYQYEWDSNYHGRPYTKYEPYSNYQFQDPEFGEKYFVQEIRIIFVIVIILFVIGIISAYLLLKKKKIESAYSLQIILLFIIILTLGFFSIYTNIALQLDNDAYHESMGRNYPKGDINHIPIDSLFGYDKYVDDDYEYSDTSIWGPGLGYYMLIIAAICNWLLMKQTKQILKKHED